MFVNVADIPTYWAYNKNLKRKIDHTETIYVQTGKGITPLKPFKLTPLMKELNLNVLNVDNNPITQIPYDFKSNRVAVKTDNMTSIIPEAETLYEAGKVDTSAMFFIIYGEGEFLISLLWLNELPDNETRTVVRDLIINSLISKLNQKKEIMLASGD